MTPAPAVAVKNLKTVMDKLTGEKPFAAYIEQTLLRPDATKDEVQKMINNAMEFHFYGVCIAPYFVKYAKDIIKEDNLKIITVVGFPFGYQTITAKVEEAKRTIQDGTDEIDMVMNIAAFKSKEYTYVKEELDNLVTLCRLKNKILKVIVETCLLSKDEIIKACELCIEMQVDFVKTSTGFNGEGAKIEIVKLMREMLPEKIKIKASGGIRQRKFAERLISAGASRIGTSSGEALLKEK